MRWSPLARKEFYDHIQSKGVWLLGGLLIVASFLSLGGPPYLVTTLGENTTLVAFQAPVSIFATFGAILLSHRSISSERASGSIKVVSGMPVRRRHILLGKIIGQTAVLCVPLLLTFLVVGALGALEYGLFSLAKFGLLVVVSCLYLLLNVCVGVSISAAVNTSVQAATAAFSYYLIFILGWVDFIIYQVYTPLTGVQVNPLNPPASESLFLLHRLAPAGAYNVLFNWILETGNSASWVLGVIADLQPQTRSNALVVELAFEGVDVPVVLHEAGALVIFAGWILLPFAVGYYRFREADLT